MTETPSRSGADPLIYVIAGEPSGDRLGAALIAALRERTGGRARFAGIGGEAMRKQGLASLFPMADLSVMGLAEVVPRLPRILRRIDQTVADIGHVRPDAVVTIDSWGFCGRVQSRLKRLYPAIARIHYVAPMVWVWKPGRARTLARVLDLLLTLLPFEPPWFEREGLAARHVGHPVIENPAGDGVAFRARHGLGGAPLLMVLPGSRRSETSRLLPVFAATLEHLKSTHPDLRVVVPTVETVAAEVRRAVAGWPLPALVVEGAEKADAFAAGTAALAASGTVALELALARLPTVIAYKVSPLSAFVAIRFLGLNLTYVTLVNILMDATIVPEFLQGACRPDRLAAAVAALLDDPGARARQQAGTDEALRRLGLGGDSPSRRAAEAVLTLLDHRKTETLS